MVCDVTMMCVGEKVYVRVREDIGVCRVNADEGLCDRQGVCGVTVKVGAV